MVRDADVHLRVLQEIRDHLEGLGFFLHRVSEAVPRGKQGNREFMTLWIKGVRPTEQPDLEAACSL